MASGGERRAAALIRKLYPFGVSSTAPSLPVFLLNQRKGRTVIAKKEEEKRSVHIERRAFFDVARKRKCHIVDSPVGLIAH